MAVVSMSTSLRVSASLCYGTSIAHRLPTCKHPISKLLSSRTPLFNYLIFRRSFSSDFCLQSSPCHTFHMYKGVHSTDCKLRQEREVCCAQPCVPQSPGVAVRTMKTLPFLQEKYLCSSMLWNRSVHSRGDPSRTSSVMLFQTLRIINSYRIH